MRRQYDWNKNKKCLDCNKHIANYSTRCIICRNRTIKRKPKILKNNNCQICGNQFSFYKSAEKGMFCSYKCKYEWQRGHHKVKCKTCKKIFERQKSRHGKYCSLKCFGITRRIENPLKPYHANNWRNIRLKILNRDKRCQICQENNIKKLDVHHIIRYRLYKNNLPENLITLCKSCHSIVERRVGKNYGELKKSGNMPEMWLSKTIPELSFRNAESLQRGSESHARVGDDYEEKLNV